MAGVSPSQLASLNGLRRSASRCPTRLGLGRSPVICCVYNRPRQWLWSDRIGQAEEVVSRGGASALRGVDSSPWSSSGVHEPTLAGLRFQPNVLPFVCPMLANCGIFLSLWRCSEFFFPFFCVYFPSFFFAIEGHRAEFWLGSVLGVEVELFFSIADSI